MIRPHEKRHTIRLQEQVMENIAAGVNKMNELQAKELKWQEESEKKRKKEKENLFKFRREKAKRSS